MMWHIMSPHLSLLLELTQPNKYSTNQSIFNNNNKYSNSVLLFAVKCLFFYPLKALKYDLRLNLL